MSAIREALAALGRQTAAGHYAELANLPAGCRHVTYGLVAGVPCVVGVEGSTVWCATATWRERVEPPVSCGQPGENPTPATHWVLRGSGLTVTHLGERAARKLEAAANARIVPRDRLEP
jgi:hypothetical protein